MRVDDAAATEQGFGHLISLGHRRIGLLIGPEDHVPSRRRLATYTGLAAKAGIDTADAVARTMFSLEAGHAAANKLIRAGVTGIICGSDILALGAIRAVRRMGLDVPADVSVIGYDDSALMTCTDPPLTTIRQPIDAMGRALVAALVHQNEGGAAGTEELLFEPSWWCAARPGRSPGPAARRASAAGCKCPAALGARPARIAVPDSSRSADLGLGITGDPPAARARRPGTRALQPAAPCGR